MVTDTGLLVCSKKAKIQNNSCAGCGPDPGSNPGRRAAECNLGQVVYIHVPLPPSSIIWYRSMGGDVQRLGR